MAKEGILVASSGAKSTLHSGAEEFHGGRFPVLVAIGLVTQRHLERLVLKLHNLFKLTLKGLTIIDKIRLQNGAAAFGTGVPNSGTKSPDGTLDRGLTQFSDSLDGLHGRESRIVRASGETVDSGKNRYLGGLERIKDIPTHLGEGAVLIFDRIALNPNLLGAYSGGHELSHLAGAITKEGTKDLMAPQLCGSLSHLVKGA